MRKSVEKRISALRQEKRSLSIRHKIVLLLICAVAAMTTYTMVLPAITMEGDYICGKEVHVHEDRCYQVLSDGTKELICGKEEHIHDETCLVHSESAKEQYTCGYDYEHIHGDECYRNGTLICTLKEHIHRDSCLPDARRAMAESPAQETEQVTETTVQEEAAAAQTDPAAQENATQENATQAPVEEETAAQTELPTQSGEDAAQTSEDAPTEQPSELPTEEPTEQPSQQETEAPTEQPSDQIQENLSEQPSELPSEQATEQPTDELTEEMTMVETVTEEAMMQGDAAAIANYSSAQDKIIPMDTLSGTTVTFTMKKGNQEVIPELTSANNTYVFTLSIESNQFREYTPGQVQEIYSTVVNFGDMTLMLGDSEALIPAEQYAANYVRVNENSAAWMKIIRQGDGSYLFLFKSVLSQVRSIAITGNATGANQGTKERIEKSSTFNPEAFTYDYVVDAYVPAAVDTYDQYYRMNDWTVVDNETKFNGFLQNLDTLKVYYRQEGDFQEIKPIDQAVNDPAAKLAYYIDGNGVVYIYNRTTHAGAHAVQAPVEYPGWGICWEQSKETVIRFTYTDTHTKTLYKTGSQVHNVARLWNQDENVDQNEGVRAEDDVDYGGILSKTFESVDNETTLVEYVITFNDRGSKNLDMGDTPVIFQDEIMSNGTIVANSFRVVNKTTGNTLSSGYTVDVAQDGKSFRLVLNHPGSSTYELHYKVQQEDKANNKCTNRIILRNSGESRMYTDKVAVYDANNVQYVSKNFRIRLELTKLYEQNNPDKGAVFGIYAVGASGDELVAISATEAAGGQNDPSPIHTQRTCFTYYEGNRFPMTNTIYQAGGSVDTIVFTPEVGLTFDQLYYIQEIEAPFGYTSSDQKIYFYACNPDPSKSSSVPAEVSSLPAGTQVYRLDDWNEVLNSENILEDQIDHDFTNDVGRLYNNLVAVALPETGGLGLSVWMTSLGLGAACAAAVTLLRKRVRSKGR